MSDAIPLTLPELAARLSEVFDRDGRRWTDLAAASPDLGPGLVAGRDLRADGGSPRQGE